jgi:glycosyltransferase involved in cell wall biosynthesis
VPLIITPHGGDIKENDKGIIINSRITARIKKTFSSAQAVTAISSDIKKRVLKLGAPHDRIHIIPNGVIVDDFKPFSIFYKKKSYDNSYVLYLGGLKKIKGIDILLRAFAIIKKDCPDLKLKIAGAGKEMDNLKELSNELGISTNVDFLGMVRGDEKIRLLQNALFLVLSSRSEGLPVVILEAFASGIPVIASRVGGIPDIVNDGVNGFLVSPEDIKELAEKMAVLLDKASLRGQFGSNALVTASSYNWQQIAEQYISLYKGLINEPIKINKGADA